MRKNNNIDIHKSCSTLSIYNFYNILQNNDYRYLIVNYDEYTEKEIYLSYKKDEFLINIFDNIVNEYSGLIATKKTLLNYKARVDLLILSLKYSAVTKILEIYSESKSIEVLGLVTQFGFKFFKKEDIGKQIDSITNKMFGLKNTINIKKINYEKKYGKELKNCDELDIIKDLDKEALFLEVYLKTGYEINVKKTTVERWVNLKEMKLAKDKINK